jgi:branched-subunit amino acid aminotransferase/4-amino-4-deoxychorismate lyase
MSEIDAIFRWDQNALHLLEDCDVAERSLEVADSFLVSDGRVLAVDLHRERFLASAAARGYDGDDDLDAFWHAALSIIPRQTQWFPRFELARQRDAWQLQFRLRPAPQLAETVVLATHRGPDPRTAPTVKGPDLEAMMRLRQEAQRAGAQEAVLLDDSAVDSGAVADGATSALLWWREDTLCQPPLSLPRVDSVTARSILTIASATGVAIREEAARPDELEGCEVWAVNALHGIRLVTEWVDGPAVITSDTRALRWRMRLAALARPLP